MKKLLTLLALLVFCAPAMAAEKYASVDIEKIFKGYKKTEVINNTIQKQESAIRVFIADAQKNVVSATSEATRKTLEEKYAKELQAKMDKLQQDKINALQGLENDIKKAIGVEGKKGGYSLVLTNTNALYGAIDISDSVIQTLNATMK